MYKKYNFSIVFLLVLSVLLFFVNMFGLVGPAGFFIWLIVPFLLTIASTLSLFNLIGVVRGGFINKNFAITLMILSFGFLLAFLGFLFFTS